MNTPINDKKTAQTALTFKGTPVLDKNQLHILEMNVNSLLSSDTDQFFGFGFLNIESANSTLPILERYFSNVRLFLQEICGVIFLLKAKQNSTNNFILFSSPD